MQIRPNGNMLLIRPDAPETMTTGGLYIPDSAQIKPPSGHVIVAGPGVWTRQGRVELPLMPGDHVMFNKNSGWRFRQLADNRIEMIRLSDPYDERDLLIINVKDILCVVKDASLEPAA